MTRRTILGMLVLQFVAVIAAAAPCTQPAGYFHQVTRLRGTVVGVSDDDWRHAWRWFRQRASVVGADLTLYDYRSDVKADENLSPIKVAKANKHGVFDFGVLPKGHYILRITAPWGGETSFDVEITSLPKPVDIVMIDISNLYPDCTGGREFTALAK